MGYIYCVSKTNSDWEDFICWEFICLESVKTLNKMKFLHIAGVSTKQNLPSCKPVMFNSNLNSFFVKLFQALHQQRMFPMFSDNRLRLLRNSCIFSLIFLTIWLPYGMFQFPLDLPREVIPEILETYMKFYFKFFRNFTYIQIALNPVILFLLSYDMRNNFPQISCPWSIWRRVDCVKEYLSKKPSKPISVWRKI